MILSPTSEISHHHKVTNTTMSPTSLSPILGISKTKFKKHYSDAQDGKFWMSWTDFLNEFESLSICMLPNAE